MLPYLPSIVQLTNISIKVKLDITSIISENHIMHEQNGWVERPLAFQSLTVGAVGLSVRAAQPAILALL